MPSFEPIIRNAYLEILKRPPDPSGLVQFDERMNRGLSEAGLRETLLRSEEFAERNRLPPPLGPLRTDGNRFVNERGEEVKLLGAIACCRDARANGWPLVSLEALELFAAHRLNYTHCRLGPFTVAGEGDPNFVGYLTAPDGRVDLEVWFEPFWERARSVALHAREHGIYVEFDLVDRWVRQHGESDLPFVDPWSERNNVQGLELGGLGIFASAPGPLHERWIRKAVQELGEFESTLFQVGNEGFKQFSREWELGVYDIVKDELARRGMSDRLVATNTHDSGLEARLDYIARHARQAQRPGTKPIIVNEYSSLSAASVIRQVRQARRLGTAFMYWRGDHDRSTWEATLAALG